MEPQDEAGHGPRDAGGEARRTRARIFLVVAALFLYSAATQFFDRGADASDRLWSGLLALIAVGSGIYFWRVMREERLSGSGTDDASGGGSGAPGA